MRGSGHREGTCQACSPPTPNASRLEARIFKPGRTQQGPADQAQSSTRCSQLSRINRQVFSCRNSARLCSAVPPCRTPTPGADARMDCGIRPPSPPGGQLHGPDPAGELVQHLRRHLQRQAGLAGAAEPVERDQAVPPERVTHLGELPLPANEAGQLGRQVVGDGLQRAQRRGVAGQASCPPPARGGCRDVASPLRRCSPRSRSETSTGPDVRTSSAAACESRDLPAVRQRHDLWTRVSVR